MPRLKRLKVSWGEITSSSVSTLCEVAQLVSQEITLTLAPTLALALTCEVAQLVSQKITLTLAPTLALALILALTLTLTCEVAKLVSQKITIAMPMATARTESGSTWLGSG